MTRSLALLALSLLVASPVAAEGTVGTFTLDALSYISFGQDEVVPIPPGSTIQFHFGAPASDGSVPFTIGPGDVKIATIRLPNASGTLAYGIKSTARGTLRPAPDGSRIDFDAVVRATLKQPSGRETYDYAIPFTTATATATSRDGTETLSRSGSNVTGGARYAQIVGATTNRDNAFPKPGAAVYTVLSGRFDTLPPGR